MQGILISKATLGRLPIYLQYLKELSARPGTMISASSIARGLSLGDVQVRKDLAVISGTGKPRVGYELEKLISDIEAHLGRGGLTGAVLVGAGKLGKALLDYDGFESFGVKILAGFDCNESAIRLNGCKSILPIKDIEKFCKDNNVKLGIITVGQGSAQDVCNKLVSSGISAIWNFAPCSLHVPDKVILKQENLALSLAHLNMLISK